MATGVECVYSRQGGCRPLVEGADYLIGVLVDGDLAGDALVPVCDGHVDHFRQDFTGRLNMGADLLDVLDGGDVDGR